MALKQTLRDEPAKNETCPFILGGGILKSAEIILPALKGKVHNHAWTPWGKLKLIAAHHPVAVALYVADYFVQKAIQDSCY